MQKRKSRCLRGLHGVTIIIMSIMFLSSFSFADNYSLLESPVDTHSKYQLRMYDDTDWVVFPAYRDLEKAYEQMFPNIDVKLIGVPAGNWSQKLLTDTAGGNAPDLPRAGYQISALSERGMFMDLTEVISRWSRKLDFAPGFLDLGKHKGKQYGIPAGILLHLPIFYNKDHFRKAGLPLLEPTNRVNWNEFEQMLKKLKAAFSSRKGYYPTCVATNWGKAGFSPILYQNGGRWWSNDCETPMWTSPEAIEAFNWYTSLYRKGYSHRPSPGRKGYKEQQRLFWQGKVSVVAYGMELPRTFPMNAPNLTEEDKWGIFTLTAPGKEPVAFNWGWYQFISKEASHPAAAWAWIKLVCSNWGMKRFMRDSKYYPTISGLSEGLQKEGVYSKQVTEWYKATQPYVRIRVDQLTNYKYPETDEILQRMCEKMMYGVKDIETLAEEAKEEALELIRSKK